jgi:hypothetical protein
MQPILRLCSARLPASPLYGERTPTIGYLDINYVINTCNSLYFYQNSVAARVTPPPCLSGIHQKSTVQPGRKSRPFAKHGITATMSRQDKKTESP